MLEIPSCSAISSRHSLAVSHVLRAPSVSSQVARALSLSLSDYFFREQVRMLSTTSPCPTKLTTHRSRPRATPTPVSDPVVCVPCTDHVGERHVVHPLPFRLERGRLCLNRICAPGTFFTSARVRARATSWVPLSASLLPLLHCGGCSECTLLRGVSVLV